MHCPLGGSFLSKMENLPNGDLDSQAMPSNPEPSAEASEFNPPSQRATSSPEVAPSNTILSLSETEASFAGDEAHGDSHNSPSSRLPQPIDTAKLLQRFEDFANVSFKSELQSESRSATHSDLPAVSKAHTTLPTHSLDAVQTNTSLHRRRVQRNCRAPGVKHVQADPPSGLEPGDAASAEKQLGLAERHRHTAGVLSGNGDRGASHSASVSAEQRNLWAAKATGCPAEGNAASGRSVRHEGEPSWQDPQLTQLSSGLTGSQMVKSVSPAGVVRIGGRNRRKRTKYDLAYKQMEELGPFEEEAKSVDLSKVSGSSFALELLRNPQQYSYESWAYGFAWPVGADGRRLLLRKLRGVYWSNPEKWQRVLQENNLYRRDLFTLATVQELFKVTHLMGAEVWDFLLKCTALTQKCDALSSKDIEIGEDEAPEVSSPPAAPQRISQPLGTEACKSEDDLHASSNKFFGSGLPCSGFLRKRMACSGRDEKEMSKRSRGRPRKSHFKVQGRSSGVDDHAGDPQATRKMHTPTSVSGRDITSRWLKVIDTSPRTKNESFQSFRASLGEALERRLIRMEDQTRIVDQGIGFPSTDFSERQRLVAALLRSAAPLSNSDRIYRPPPATKSSLGAELRLPNGGRSNSSLLKLTAHYTFMAQFMQCCMLVEVQRTLLRLAEEFKPAWSSEKDLTDSSPEQSIKSMDPTAQACFDSLIQSSNVHMEFVQIIVQQLHRQAGQSNASAAPARHCTSKLNLSEELETIMQQLQHHRNKHRTPEIQLPTGASGDSLQAFMELSQRQLEQCLNASSGQRLESEETGGLENIGDHEMLSSVRKMQCHTDAPAESRFGGLTSSQASSPE